MSKLAKTLQAAAGNAGGDKLYVEDVFSTYLYTGTGSTQTITNGIDLDGEGGLVWAKRRDSGTALHTLIDTVRGVNKQLFSSSTASEYSYPDTITAFNSNGFTLGSDTSTEFINANNALMASWTFRKAPKFFDVVTYTGDGTTSNQIAHSLDATPGMIVVKRTDSTSNWAVAVYNGSNYDILPGLNLKNSRLFTSSTSYYTSTYFDAYAMFQQFTDVPANDRMNVSGATYVAYLFAHDAGGFGDDGEQNVISCGSFTTDGSGNATVDLGYEPQWVMNKTSVGTADNWLITDTMRGASHTSAGFLFANLSNAEGVAGYEYNTPTANGFNVRNHSSSTTYIYIAIRRPMKTPESGTEVFATNATTNLSTGTKVTTGFPIDLQIYPTGARSDVAWKITLDRLRGVSTTDTESGTFLNTTATSAEATTGSRTRFWDNTGFQVPSSMAPGGTFNAIYWNFRRAPGFMDVVAYTGDGVARAVPHNLGVAPELMIIKPRDSTGGEWKVYSNALSIQSYLRLNLNEAFVNFGAPGPWNNTAPTDSAFNVSESGWSTNDTGRTYIAYLFATLAGVSKVGSYTGTGANLNVDCGFSAGARFILIKRTDSTGDWYVWDSVRGISAGNDPYLLLNSTAAEVTSTDYIDPLSSGFTVTSSAPAALNASGGTYIFLAIA